MNEEMALGPQSTVKLQSTSKAFQAYCDLNNFYGKSSHIPAYENLHHENHEVSWPLVFSLSFSAEFLILAQIKCCHIQIHKLWTEVLIL